MSGSNVLQTKSAKITSTTDLSTTEAKWCALQKISYTDDTGQARTWEMATRRTRGSGGIDAVAIGNVILHPSRAPSTILVIQYRPPLDAYTIEWPAGLIDADETVEEAALRELKEETGYVGKVVSVSPTVASDPGLTNANMALCMVEVQLGEGDDEEPEQRLDDGEHITRVTVPLDGLYDRLVEYSKEDRVCVAAKLFHFAMGMNFARTAGCLIEDCTKDLGRLKPKDQARSNEQRGRSRENDRELVRFHHALPVTSAESARSRQRSEPMVCCALTPPATLDREQQRSESEHQNQTTTFALILPSRNESTRVADQTSRSSINRWKRQSHGPTKSPPRWHIIHTDLRPSTFFRQRLDLREKPSSHSTTPPIPSPTSDPEPVPSPGNQKMEVRAQNPNQLNFFLIRSTTYLLLLPVFLVGVTFSCYFEEVHMSDSLPLVALAGVVVALCLEFLRESR